MVAPEHASGDTNDLIVLQLDALTRSLSWKAPTTVPSDAVGFVISNTNGYVDVIYTVPVVSAATHT